MQMNFYGIKILKFIPNKLKKIVSRNVQCNCNEIEAKLIFNNSNSIILELSSIENISNTETSNQRKRQHDVIESAHAHKKSKSNNNDDISQNNQVPNNFSSSSSQRQKLISNSSDSDIQNDINKSQFIEAYNETQSIIDDSRDNNAEETVNILENPTAQANQPPQIKIEIQPNQVEQNRKQNCTMQLQ